MKINEAIKFERKLNEQAIAVKELRLMLNAKEMTQEVFDAEIQVVRGFLQSLIDKYEE